jgi:hypothetical protein
MTYEYSDTEREDDEYALPDIEVFQLTASEVAEIDEDLVNEYRKRHEFRLATMNSKVREKMFDTMIAEETIQGGWFWQSRFPGCMPDSDPFGPFQTRDEALADARA